MMNHWKNDNRSKDGRFKIYYFMFVSFSNYTKLTVKNIRNIEIKAMSGIMENEVDFA